MIEASKVISTAEDSAAKDISARWFMPDSTITNSLLEQSAVAHHNSLCNLFHALEASGLLAAQSDVLNYAMARLNSSDGTLRAWLLNPCLRNWMSQFGEAVELVPDLGQLENLLIEFPSVAVDPWAGVPFDFELPVHQQTVIFARTDRRIRVTESINSVRLHGSGYGETGASNVEIDAPPLVPVSAIAIRNDLPALRVTMQPDRVPQRQGSVTRTLGAGDGAGMSYPPIKTENVFEAAHLLSCAWPEEWDDICQFLQVIVPFYPPNKWDSDGFTISSMQGACWLNPRDLLTTFESLVHESSHIKLRYIEEAVALLAPVQSAETHAVGWRSDPRPIIGIFEGVYVHLHIAEALRRLIASNLLDSNQAGVALARLQVVERDAKEGVELLARHAHFTDAGWIFLEWAGSKAGVNA